MNDLYLLSFSQLFIGSPYFGTGTSIHRHMMSSFSMLISALKYTNGDIQAMQLTSQFLNYHRKCVHFNQSYKSNLEENIYDSNYYCNVKAEFIPSECYYFQKNITINE